MNFDVLLPNIPDVDYNIDRFGILNMDPKNNQQVIQKAIDEVSKQGGGRLILKAGIFSLGPIELKSKVNLHLPINCYLKFVKSKEFYAVGMRDWEGKACLRCNSPISALNQTDIAITGKGIIDGCGDMWRPLKEMKVTKKFFDKCLAKSPYFVEGKEGKIWYPSKSSYDGCIITEQQISLENANDYYDYFRPVLISIVSCDRVLLDGFITQNSPAWNVHPLFCNNLTVSNMNIKNEYWAQNGDGIDVESCTNVEIKNSIFEVGDDGICIKSGKNKEARKIKKPTMNVNIHDCLVYHAHGGIVIGSEMSRGVKNLYCTNCTFVGTDIGVRFKSALGRGGVVEDIFIKDIYMTDIIGEAMIFNMDYSLFKMAHELTDDVKTSDPEDIPYFRNIYLENINCESSKIALKVIGINEETISNIEIKNSYIKSENDISLANCKNIIAQNTTFEINGVKKHYENVNLVEEF